jgi:hypothetical protein
MREHAQITRTLFQGLAERHDLFPVGVLGRNELVAVLLFRLALRGPFQGGEIGVEFQIFAGWGVPARSSSGN